MQAAANSTAKQLAFLKSLAAKTGTSFAYPHTRAQASAEIRRLQGRKATTDARLERDNARFDRRAVVDAMHGAPLSAAAVRDHEITGYGSTATWG